MVMSDDRVQVAPEVCRSNVSHEGAAGGADAGGERRAVGRVYDFVEPGGW